MATNADQPIDLTPADGISQRQMEELTDADRRLAKLTRIAGLAAFNSAMLYFFGGLSLLIAFISPTASNFIVGTALIGLGWVEQRGRRQMLAGDLRGPNTLAINQLAVLALITLYCLYQMSGKSETEIELEKDRDLANLVSPKMIHDMTVVTYEIVIGGSIIFQGLMARAYYRAGQRLREHVANTPAWVLEVQRKRHQ